VWLHNSRCGGENDKYFIVNFLLNSMGERILKIDEHLAKLLTKNVVGFFMTHSVDRPVRNSRRFCKYDLYLLNSDSSDLQIFVMV